ncbi:thiamine diphosphokinase [Paenibacillus sp. sptzw28]|uniref:thiamine diphosphokinase n=1 Tax=Paenibacillus sp. sptzw28 TaxID=715179 RepID=UPI0028697F72|nr:thiamine diphosphokinase [Paenibacillus sp. sptzw28]
MTLVIERRRKYTVKRIYSRKGTIIPLSTNRILIFTGGRLGPWALSHITPEDLLIGADGGALFLVSHGMRPNIALGDFDSVTPEQLALIEAQSDEIIACDPIDKDYTDTELAWRLALTKHPHQIMLFGALGSRFDHSLANIHLLRSAAESGVDAAIVDENNLIQLTTNELVLTDNNFPYVSLLPLSTTVTGITLSGFRYPLHDAALEIGQSLGISNVLSGRQGLIRIREGLLLVIQSRD